MIEAVKHSLAAKANARPSSAHSGLVSFRLTTLANARAKNSGLTEFRRP